MEQQHQPRIELVKLPFFTAEIEAHLQSLLERVLVGGSRWGLTGTPEGRDSHRRRVPAEAGGGADFRLQQRFFQQFPDRHGPLLVPEASVRQQQPATG